MTGFCSIEAQSDTARLRIEVKAVNHRFLDLKLRLPRELSALEGPSRALLQSKLSRGSVEVRVDFEATQTEADEIPETNFSLAAHYFETLTRMQKMLGLDGTIRTMDIALMPDVIRRKNSDALGPEAQTHWPLLERGLIQALDKLHEMRAHEGSNLQRALTSTLEDIQAAVTVLRGMREKIQALETQKLRERISRIFEAFPIQNATAEQVLESRIAQELALLLERGDVEEELIRLEGHRGAFLKALNAGGAVGRKLEFLVQEMHREINTLGSKSQDLGISDQVVAMKVRLEQIREQVMNLE
jgi:uncharacterized protein (TIGR00255 family)